MTSVSLARPVDLPDLGPAPELANSVWLNTDSPLRLADLRGKVVGLEMWTFGCINCQHVMPSSEELVCAVQGSGLRADWQSFPRVQLRSGSGQPQDRPWREDGIEYPVAQDNDGATWNAYHNSYWPALYLIDKRGHIRYVHIGEGAYDETEANIKTLLAEAYP